MKNTMIQIRWIVLCIFTIVGCAKNDSSNPVNAPSKGGTTAVGPVISNAQRSIVFNGLTLLLDSLRNINLSSIDTSILAYFRSHPEFSGSGISSDGTIWGMFTDGRLVIYNNNLLLDDGTQPSVAPAGSTHALQKSFGSIPNGSNVFLLNSLGKFYDYNFFITGASAAMNRVESAFKKTDYTGIVKGAATIAALKSVRNASILLWFTHGGIGKQSDFNTDEYGLMTAEEQDSISDVLYSTDLDQKRLIYGVCLKDRTLLGTNVNAVYYAITNDFIREYMSFTPNSLVYITACESNNAGMKSAFAAKNVSVYGGWTAAIVASQAFEAAQFFFDRSLAAGIVNPVPSPPQRPFGWQYVWDDMVYRGMTKHTDDNSVVSNLIFTQIGGDMTDLLPTIKFTTFKSSGGQLRFVVEGSFGSSPGSVLVNGTTLSASPWGPVDILCDLPTSGGTVQVVVNGLKSNPVQLTKWSGSVSYTETGRGSLKKFITANLNFIGDVHKYRIVSGANSVWKDEPVFLVPRAVTILPSSSCSFECSGEYRDNQGVLQESWSGSGNIPFVTSGASIITPSASFTGTVGDVGQSCILGFGAMATYQKYTKDNGTTTAGLTMANGTGGIIELVDQGFSLQQGTTTVSLTNGSATFSWTNFTPTFTPDPNAPR